MRATKKTYEAYKHLNSRKLLAWFSVVFFVFAFLFAPLVFAQSVPPPPPPPPISSATPTPSATPRFSPTPLPSGGGVPVGGSPALSVLFGKAVIPNFLQAKSVGEFLKMLINFLVFLGFIAAGFMIVYGGIMLMLSLGNEERRRKAKNILAWAIA